MQVIRTAGPLTLPRELQDAIIDLCHDKHTIIACSLVSRSWLFASRRRTFSKVSLIPHNIKSFLRLLRSPFCTIRPFISQLELLQSHGFRLDFDLIVPCLAGCPSVRNVLIQMQGLGRYLGSIDPGLHSALQDGFSAITTLEIHIGSWQSLAEFVTILSAFPKIEHLVLLGGLFADKKLPPANQQHPFCHLTTLVLYSSSLIDVVRWLLSHDHLPPIKTLHVSHYETALSHMSLWNEFIVRLGSSLEHLHLDDVHVDTTVHDLSHNTSLRSLHICHTSELPGNYFFPYISTIKSSQIESVIIEIFYTAWITSASVYDTHWAHLDAVFSEPQFANLQKIEFWHTGSRIINFIQRMLPRCETRKILRFSTHHRYHVGAACLCNAL